MNQRFSGKFAIITGAASGIGAATAWMFAAEGAAVALLDIDGAAAERLAGELPRAAGYECDVTSSEQVRRAVAAAAERFGTVHIVFNNAGVAIRRRLAEQDEESWDRVIDTNLKGAYLCSAAALPFFPERGGCIIHTSSVTGITGVRDRAAYSAAKAGLVGLTRNMALDYAHRGIRVNAVCPGFVRTPFIEGITSDEKRLQRLVGLHPLGRLGEPEDIARAVLFLASDDASWITGHALAVDGGFSTGVVSEI